MAAVDSSPHDTIIGKQSKQRSDSVNLQPVSHHTAISSSNLQATLSFYAHFGFKVVHEYQDESVTIVHAMLSDGYVLEIFAFAANAGQPPIDFSSGNDLRERGVKHLGLKVADIQRARVYCESLGLTLTETKRGRTEIDYFFVRDPDGMWLELVQDDRNLHR